MRRLPRRNEVKGPFFLANRIREMLKKWFWSVIRSPSFLIRYSQPAGDKSSDQPEGNSDH